MLLPLQEKSSPTSNIHMYRSMANTKLPLATKSRYMPLRDKMVKFNHHLSNELTVFTTSLHLDASFVTVPHVLRFTSIGFEAKTKKHYYPRLWGQNHQTLWSYISFTQPPRHHVSRLFSAVQSLNACGHELIWSDCHIDSDSTLSSSLSRIYSCLLSCPSASRPWLGLQLLVIGLSHHIRASPSMVCRLEPLTWLSLSQSTSMTHLTHIHHKSRDIPIAIIPDN